MDIGIIGSGWLAQPLARHLIQADHAVCLTSTQPAKVSALNQSGLTCLLYNLGQSPLPAQLQQAQWLILTTACKNLAAHQQLLAQIYQTTKLLFISSTSVYLNNGKTHTELSTDLNPDSPLVSIENAILKHPVHQILRLTGLVGPGRHPGRFGRLGRPLKNPNAPVNLVHLTDVISAIEAIINGTPDTRQVHHLCAHNHPSKQAYYSHMANQLGYPAPEFEASNTGSNKIIDCTLTLNSLGLSLKYPNVFEMNFE